MKLTEQIAAFSEEIKTKVPVEILQKVKSEIERIAATGIAETALKAGDKAIDFTLPDAGYNPVSLSDLLQKGNVIISFSRGTWCPFCTMEYRALQSKLPEIQGHNATLIGISPQLPSSSKESIAQNGFEFPILFDKGNEVARKYGLVFKLSEEFGAVNVAFGTDLSVINGDNSNELPIPATYVINQQGVIIYAFVNPSWAERAEPEDYIGVLK